MMHYAYTFSIEMVDAILLITEQTESYDITLFVHKDRWEVHSHYILKIIPGQVKAGQEGQYIISFLLEWGEDIEWKLINQTIPIIGNVSEGSGVSKIVVIAKDRQTPLTILATELYLTNDRISAESVELFSKHFSSFSETLFVNLDFESISFVKYTRDKNHVDIKQRKIDLSKRNLVFEGFFSRQESDISKNLRSMLTDSNTIPNLFYDLKTWPHIDIESNFESLMELYYWREFSDKITLVVEELLELEPTRAKYPCVVIGGEMIRYYRNLALPVLIITDLLQLHGITKIMIDQYNIGSLIHRLEKPKVFKGFLNCIFEEWGNVVVLEPPEKRSFDEFSVSSAKITDDLGARKIVPLYNQIMNIPVEGEGTFEIELFQDFSIYPGLTKIKVTDLFNHIIIDQREHKKMYEKNIPVRLLLEWMSGMNIIKRSRTL